MPLKVMSIDTDTNAVASDSNGGFVEVSDGGCNWDWGGVEREDLNCRQITKMLKTLIPDPRENETKLNRNNKYNILIIAWRSNFPMIEN